MAFKFKDLMVEVNPTAAAAQFRPQFFCFGTGCAIWTWCGVRTQCGATYCAATDPIYAPVGCGGTRACLGSIDPTVAATFGGDPAQQLQQLKTNLREAIERVEAEEKALEASQRPQTLAEANELESKLQGAIEELRRQKKDLK